MYYGQIVGQSDHDAAPIVEWYFTFIMLHQVIFIIKMTAPWLLN